MSLTIAPAPASEECSCEARGMEHHDCAPASEARCDACGGSGWRGGDGNVPCWKCGGTGGARCEECGEPLSKHDEGSRLLDGTIKRWCPPRGGAREGTP